MIRLIEFVLIVAGAITVIIGIIAIIKKITDYYNRKYGFSIWSGVLFIEFALIIGGFDITRFAARNALLWIACCAVLLFVLVQDIRLAGLMGLLAFIFQIIMSVFFLAVIALAIFGYIIKIITRRTNAILNVVTGTTKEFREGIIHISKFLRF